LNIKQGDIFWIQFSESKGSELVYKHPHVVIQNNIFNASNINTVAVCALTSNLKRAQAPGNVLLHKGESNLKKTSVVNISQIITVDKADCVEKIGTLTQSRIQEILDGILLLVLPRD
jgi:mRNA interferase MazF